MVSSNEALTDYTFTEDGFDNSLPKTSIPTETVVIDSDDILESVDQYGLSDADKLLLRICLEKGFLPAIWRLRSEKDFLPGEILNGITWEILKKKYPELNNEAVEVNRTLFDHLPTHEELKKFVTENCRWYASKFTNKEVFSYYKEILTKADEKYYQRDRTGEWTREQDARANYLGQESEALLAKLGYATKLIVVEVNCPFTAEEIAQRISIDDGATQAIVRKDLLNVDRGSDSEFGNFGDDELGIFALNLLRGVISDVSLRAGTYLVSSPEEIMPHLDSLLQNVKQYLEIEFEKFSTNTYLVFGCLGKTDDFTASFSNQPKS